MRNKPWFPILYMFVVTAVFSSILIGLSRFTRDRVEANELLAFEKAVLMALSFDLSETPRPDEIHAAYVERVRPPSPSSSGAYQLMDGDRIAGYALPIEGQGFWDRIRGVVGIAPDRRTIMGISFYEQAETPGLGAEIARPWFCDQFIGKTISESGKPFGIKPAGSTLSHCEVHAVTGATQTSTRLEKIIIESLTQWRDGVERGGMRP